MDSASTTAPVAAESDVNPLDRLAGGIFVGREKEMDELRAGLEDALSGRGRLMMLVGEPGIGKTRTSEEFATYARLRNVQVLWGRCYEGEGAPAYWPWVQIIRSYVHDKEPKELMSEMGPGAADIAQVVSEVEERLPGLPAPPALEPEQARFRLFDSITTFLKNASQGQPLMVVLDDLHWADKPSLLLLQFLAKELRGSAPAGARHLPRRRAAAPAPARADAGRAEPREPEPARPAARPYRARRAPLHRDHGGHVAAGRAGGGRVQGDGGQPVLRQRDRAAAGGRRAAGARRRRSSSGA